MPHSRSVDEGNLDEERRLFYVGITRARERLTMTYCDKRSRYGQEERCQPSCFISEIPKRMYEFVDYDKLMKTSLTEDQCEDAIASLRALLDD